MPLSGKRPITTHGVKDASSDPAKAREWWTQNPDANVGIAAGDGLVVVDIDPRNGGDKTLARLEKRYGPLPPTVEVITGGGGKHFYYSANGNAPGCGQLGPGVDIKSAGGYVVAPPSVHPETKRIYKWRKDHSPQKHERASLPDWVADHARDSSKDDDEAAAITEGSRNQGLTSFAGTLRREGLSQAELEAALLALNESRCDPPLPVKEVRQIARSIARYDATNGDAALLARPADLTKARPPRWAWLYRILLGYLNLLLGDEGVGKGTTAAYLMARWTEGRLPGDLEGEPVSVAVLGDEDSFDHVWTPRLHVAGADLNRVFQIERPDGGMVTLREDRDRLAAVIQERGIRVLYLDALLDNLGVGVDDWRAKAVREALQPARWLARELDIAVIGSLHPNKSGNSFRQLVAGSSAFNAVSRSSLLLAKDPDNPGGRVLVRGKGNLSIAPDAVQFDITGAFFDANGHKFDAPVATNFQNGGNITADDLIARAEPPKRHTKRGEVEDLLHELLPKDGKWHPAKPIYSKCADAGFTDERMVRRARDELGIEHRREEKFGGKSQWRWPNDATRTRDGLTDPAESSPGRVLNTRERAHEDTDGRNG